MDKTYSEGGICLVSYNHLADIPFYDIIFVYIYI